jgi:disulfide bond formation protein DsbB
MMSIRSAYFLGFIAVCILLLTSIYLQVFDGIMPCPLCTLQRVMFGVVGLLFFIGLLVHARKLPRMIINSLVGFSSLIGMALAGRQVWLQNFPQANSNECEVSLQYMMQVLPWNQLLQKIFAGNTECSKKGVWDFLYLNMAEWALICFGLFLLLTIYLFLKEFKA